MKPSKREREILKKENMKKNKNKNQTKKNPIDEIWTQPVDMFEHAYDRMPAYLKDQKEAFAGEVAEMREGDNSG